MKNRNQFSWPFCVTILVYGLLSTCVNSKRGEAAGPERIEFNRDIRPILSDRCFVCHGPDSAKREAGLRLDRADEAMADREGTRAIVPRDLMKSDAYQRMISQEPDLQMPPPKSGLTLTRRELDLIRRWILEGAEYQPHWAFVAPRASVPPFDPFRESTSLEESIKRGTRSPIDAFVRAKQAELQFHPSAESDRSSLLRRASFDLIGLPPTLEELTEFETDQSPDAFERQVDRLLASPRYGERMATIWLDAARYADTNGYQTDGPRFMWRYRDWVIDAFNRNQAFDEFTIHQLAGDLLAAKDAAGTANAKQTPSQRDASQKSTFPSSAIADDRLIASGFNRNHRGNAEGGIIPEEFRVEYVVDRVETTSTVWLGLTMGCARCHDHKYDPISQREFYQLFDFFNRVPEPGKYIRNSNSMPYLPAPTSDQLVKLKELESEAAFAVQSWMNMSTQVQKGIERLADQIRKNSGSIDWMEEKGLDSRVSFDGGSHIVRTKNPAGTSTNSSTGVWDGGEAVFVDGRIGKAGKFDGHRSLNAGDIGDFGEEESFAISLWLKPDSFQEPMTILARMDHENASRGYELRLEANGRLQVLFAGRILDDLIRIETREPLVAGQWTHVFVSYDGSSAARGVVIRVNGQRSDVSVITDLLSNPIRVKLPLILGAGGSARPFMGEIDEVRMYRGRLTDETALALAAGDAITTIVISGKPESVSPPNATKLREFYLSQHASDQERQARQRVLETRARYDAFLATIPTTMVMQDVDGLRKTHVLSRGEYNKPVEAVSSGVPSILASSVKVQGSAPNRLDLARWLISPRHPLTSRVTVNRYWQMLFGSGLVKTAEDFGTQGELPSHPELLDWLAVEFAGDAKSEDLCLPNRFNTKRMLRLLVTSATYRQSSRVESSVLQRDPDNRWLSRGPRFRLTAEMIRDAALAASGLLVETLGGPSVKPYQPAGLWEELSAEAVPGPFSIYVQDHGANLYRRSLYTYQKRTVTTPAMAVFDASSRDFCRVKLPRTNTPLQALNLMNDITYLEASRVLAEQAQRDGGQTEEDRIAWSFRRVLSRRPTDEELSRLLAGYRRRLSLFREHPEAVSRLLSAGEYPQDKSIPATDTAALAATAAVILNLDEAANR